MKTSSIMITCTSDKLQLTVLQNDLFVPTGLWKFVCTVLQPQLGKSLAQRDASLPVGAETDIITIFCCIFCYAVQ